MASDKELRQEPTSDYGKAKGNHGGGHDGPVAGGADNTRGVNKPSREGSSGGAKAGKEDHDQNSPQGSHANPSDTRGADSTDKEFRNNQPNASTLKQYKGSGSDMGQEND